MDALTTPLPKDWQRVRLGDILSYEQPTKFLVTTTQYLQKGFTPILTAGKTFILGYTNDKHGIYTNIPVIIFDDFTTDSKMVNFPFKVKSSAIKILSLRDNNQADLKYIYEKLTLLKHQVTDHKRYWIDEFSNFEILLPPLNEQSAIANILSDLDHYLCALDALILKKEGVKKSLSFELLSQRKRLKGFNQAWQRVKVKDFGIIITGSTPLTQISEYWNGTISWITPTDINDNKDIFNSERKITQKGLNTIRMIPKNSVLVTCIASIGKNAILRVNGACNQQINAIIPNKDFNADFIYYLMENNKQYLLGKAGVTATYIISKQVFEEIDFFVPKDLNEQIAIANVLSDLDNEIASLKNKKRQFENIKKALNHDLMSAKIRVLNK
ncbi:type I R-M system specificity subunit [Helicobacter pylori NY40]|uniref:Type I R-M system specificity subunit n=1 Tax=Helicobacter pylori NY40 TaxID=1426844 RepID=A0A060PSF0_HELPX|nr:restriction endonuclease subunit S [Helicobacter pylori]BAO97525.1 type I R-M system specificity subunit [Helicobacter pylori NY40]